MPKIRAIAPADAKKGRRKRGALRKSGGGWCRDPRAIWGSLPHREEVEYRLRYCKFSITCRIATTVVLLVLSIVFFSLGSSIPLVVYSQWQNAIEEDTVLTVEKLKGEPKIGRSYGGSFNDDEDEGVNYEFMVPTIINPENVLEFGARPIMEEQGPYRMRVYRQRHNMTEPSSTDDVSFAEREFAVLTEGSMSDPVVVPNIAYRAIEKELLRLPNVRADEFEDAVIPVLFSVAFHELKERGGPMLKQASFPALCDVGFQYVVQHRHNYNRTAGLYEWATGTPAFGFDANTPLTHAFVLAPPVDGNNSFPIPPPVAAALWSWSDAFSFINAATWTRYVAPVTTTLINDYTVHFRNLEPRYVSEPGLARRHVLQIAHWINDLLRATGPEGVPGSEDARTSIPKHASRAPAYELTLATILKSYSLISNGSWNHAIPGQLGSNAVMGFASYVLANRTTGATRLLEEWAGVTLMNTCPQSALASDSGASLHDFDPLRLSYDVNVAPELSCLPWRLSGTDFRPYYSKVSSTVMLNLMNFLTTGDSVESFEIPGSLNAMRFINGITSMQNDVRRRNAILDTAESEGGLFQRVAEFEEAATRRAAAFPGSNAEKNAIQDMQAAALGFHQHKSDADVLSSNTLCQIGFLPLSMRSLDVSCYEMLDMGSWIDVIAKEYIWFPRYVWRNTDGTVSESTLRAGPLIRVTVRELLFGIYDSFYLKARGKLYPGVGPKMDTSYRDWIETGSVEDSPLLRISKGSSDLDTVGHITSYDTVGKLLIWSQVSDVTGNLDLRRFTPTADRFDSLERREPQSRSTQASLTIWNRISLRPERLQFAEVKNGPGGLLPVWRYVTSHPDDAPGYFESDRQNAAPLCMRSLAGLEGEDGSTSDINMLVGAPYMLGCDYSAKAESYSGMPRASNLTHNSHLDVEPVTGKVTSSNFQYSVYLRWKASGWYPHLRPTTGLLYTVTQSFAAPLSTAAAIRDSIHSVDYQVVTAIPASLHTFGAVMLVAAIIMGIVSVFPPPEPDDAKKKMRKSLKRRLRKEAARKAELEAKRREARRSRVDPKAMERRRAARSGKGVVPGSVKDKGFDTAVERLSGVERVEDAAPSPSNFPTGASSSRRGLDTAARLTNSKRHLSTSKRDDSRRLNDSGSFRSVSSAGGLSGAVGGGGGGGAAGASVVSSTSVEDRKGKKGRRRRR